MFSNNSHCLIIQPCIRLHIFFHSTYTNTGQKNQCIVSVCIDLTVCVEEYKKYYYAPKEFILMRAARGPVRTPQAPRGIALVHNFYVSSTEFLYHVQIVKS